MFLTLARTQHCFSRCMGSLSRLLLVGSVIAGFTATPDASPLLTDVISLAGIQANEEKTVQAQTKYLMDLAQKQIRAGEIDNGKILLQQVLMLDPQNRKAQAELSKIAQETNTSLAPGPQVLAQAGELSMDEMSATELVDAAKAMMRDADYANAEKALNQALSISRDDQERRQIRSYLNAIGKEREQAEEAIQAQLDYNPSE